MATKLYLHRTEITSPGTLPSTEQSSLTADANLFDNEDGSENRLMNKTISAVSQATLTNTTTADTNAHNYYIARWVSPLLAQTSVAANTWTVEIGIREANANANFPRNGAGANRICAYVWKPSNGTKYGNILDGNTNADGEEATTSQSVSTFTFSGSAVSSLTSGDAVIVFELWAIVTMGNATARVVDVFYDGTTENSTSNEAAWISTPENLAFQYTIPISQSISISPSIAKVATLLRSVSQSISISPAIAKVMVRARAISQSISISPSVAKVATLLRGISQSISISDSISRLKTAIRGISQSISISDAIERVFIAGGTLFERGINETISIADSVVEAALKLRSISQSIGISDSITRVATKLRSISQSVTVSDSIARMKTAIRGISQSITLSDALERVFIGGGGQLFEVACNVSISVSDSVSRMVTRVRTMNESITITDSITRIKTAIRSVSENVGITDVISKSALKIRSMIENISLSDVVTRFLPGAGQLFEVFINETISLGDSITLAIFKVIGGKPPAGNIFRTKFEKEREKWKRNWKVDWKAKYDKKIKNRFKNIGWNSS